MSSRSIVLVLAFVVVCLAQQPQQPTPQQTVNALVTQQAQLTSQIITVLNQIPALVEQNQALTKQIADLQAQKEPKMSSSDKKKIDSLNIELKKACSYRDSLLRELKK